MRRAGLMSIVAGLALAGGLLPASARADFTETLCSGGSAAAPWTEGVEGFAPFAVGQDNCGVSGGNYTFYLSSDSLAPGASASAGIEMPSGEVLTAESLSYATIPSSGGQSTYSVRYNGNQIAGGVMPFGAQDSSTPLPDATSLDFIIQCPAGAGTCTFNAPNPLSVGAITLTIHDTGSPTVAPAGGGLATSGTVAGEQTIGYSAQDVGSGVARVSASLGTDVVATAPSVCQSAQLSPCPHAVTGVLEVDTAALPNGAYPLTLTAVDMSGDATTIAVDTVRIENTGTVAVAPRPRRGHIAARLVTGWDWGRPPDTTVTSSRWVRVPRAATVSLRCAGPRCPRVPATGPVRRFDRRLRGVRFHAGDQLTFTVRAPREIAERVRVIIRDGREPIGRVLA